LTSRRRVVRCELAERPGQAEVRRERRLEVGDLADPVAGEADHDDARDM